ncbi:MAG: hypothetical protein QXV69_04580 [Sulfolobaceae archaeon]
MEPILLSEEILRCPLCNSELSHKSYVYDSGITGLLLIEIFECKVCGFRIRDVKPFEVKGKVRIEYKVKSPEDINLIVYRSAYAKISIPELGIEIESIDSKGVITTIEGIFEEILERIGNEIGEKKVEIEKAMKGEIEYTIIIEDPMGQSFIRKI